MEIRPNHTFSGKHMLMLMIGFFSVIIAVNITMAMLAGKTWTGLVVKNSYVASQKFNKQLADAEIQRVAGLKSEITYYDGTLIVVLKNRDGVKQVANKLTAVVGRPTHEQADKKLDFLPGPNNTYKLAIKLAEGNWAITIVGQTGANSYRRDARLFVDHEGKGSLE